MEPGPGPGRPHGGGEHFVSGPFLQSGSRRSNVAADTCSKGTEEDELLARLRDWIEPRLRSVRLLGSALLALIIGGGAGAWTDRLFLFLNPQSFNVPDPLFGNDVGFYVFRLPLLRDSWPRASISCWSRPWPWPPPTTSTVPSACGRGEGPSSRAEPKSTYRSYWRSWRCSAPVFIKIRTPYRLLYTNRSTQFFGAGFTDVSARLPALRLLMAISVLTAVALIVNIWRKGWTLPITAVAAWVLVAVGAGADPPGLVVEQLAGCAQCARPSVPVHSQQSHLHPGGLWARPGGGVLLRPIPLSRPRRSKSTRSPSTTSGCGIPMYSRGRTLPRNSVSTTDSLESMPIAT